MPHIRQFVQLATTNLGISEKTAQDATGSLLGFLGEKMGEGDFQAPSSSGRAGRQARRGDVLDKLLTQVPDLRNAVK